MTATSTRARRARAVVPSPLRRWVGRGLALLRARSMESYYEEIAPTYDEWWEGTGRSSGPRPGFAEDRERIVQTVRGFTPARTLDIGCGTGFMTQHLPGEVVGIDRSEQMLEIARERAPNASFVHGDALALPFPDRSFERAFICVFYGVLPKAGQRRLLTEAWRVADEIVLVDATIREGLRPFERQVRRLPDGSQYLIVKHYYTPESLAAELGGAEILVAGRYFAMVRAAR